jgi:hypothetical protein
MPRQPPPYKRERNAWYVMRRRCLRPGNKDWPYYGGKGVTICLRWMESFSNFLADMGPAPTPRYWLGRRDVEGNYEPANCLWTLRELQMNRRGYCRRVMLFDQEMTAAQAARQPGQPTRMAVLLRVERKIPLERIARRIDKRSTWILYQGEHLPVSEVARRVNLSSDVLLNRIKSGWPLEQALTPVQYRQRKPPAMP